MINGSLIAKTFIISKFIVKNKYIFENYYIVIPVSTLGVILFWLSAYINAEKIEKDEVIGGPIQTSLGIVLMKFAIFMLFIQFCFVGSFIRKYIWYQLLYISNVCIFCFFINSFLWFVFDFIGVIIKVKSLPILWQIYILARITMIGFLENIIQENMFSLFFLKCF